MSDDEQVSEFFRGLSPDDIRACFMDHILYGSAFARTGEDGIKRRIPPEEHPGMTGEENAERVRILKMYRGRITPKDSK